MFLLVDCLRRRGPRSLSDGTVCLVGRTAFCQLALLSADFNQCDHARTHLTVPRHRRPTPPGCGAPRLARFQVALTASAQWRAAAAAPRHPFRRRHLLHDLQRILVWQVSNDAAGYLHLDCRRPSTLQLLVLASTINSKSRWRSRTGCTDCGCAVASSEDGWCPFLPRLKLLRSREISGVRRLETAGASSVSPAHHPRHYHPVASWLAWLASRGREGG
jgi:hypothetical protein